jgi:hypothetical protein
MASEEYMSIRLYRLGPWSDNLDTRTDVPRSPGSLDLIGVK